MRTLELDTKEKARLLAKSGAFAMLQPEELDALCEFSEGYAYDAGEVIFERGSVARELYVVRSGTVGIYAEDREIARYVSGEAFGEMDLLGQAGRTGSARIDGAGELLVFPRKSMTFKTLLMRKPKVAANVMHRLLSLVAGRVREANRLVSESSPWIRKLRAELYSDKLTGLFTRSYIDEELLSILDPESELCTVMVKPDNFKDVNDTFGHAVGDAVLARIAHAFRDCLDDADIGIRYLGNQFAAVVPHASSDDCGLRARMIHEAMNAVDLSDLLPDSSIRLTFSVAHGCGMTAENPIELAHDRLFEVRGLGLAQLYQEGRCEQ